jgi:hypothetical protein
MVKKKMDFDFEKFKEYVNTYDPHRHGLGSDNTIVKDMVYGLGIALDEKKYSMADGFKKFVKHLVKIIL